jgi:hypothetical protein
VADTAASTIRRVTPADLQAVARRYLRPEQRTVIIAEPDGRPPDDEEFDEDDEEEGYGQPASGSAK